ncbi:unnamed protein product, partial [marine sediment metagenome]
MGTKLDKAIAWALDKFRDIYWADMLKWEDEGRHPEARPWWSKVDIREMCEYPDSHPWPPLGRALHAELGLIHRHL